MEQAVHEATNTQTLKGIFRTLTSEHRDLVRLLKRLSSTSETEVRSLLFPTLRVQLIGHERGEMEVLYPALRSRGLTYGMAEQHDDSARKLEVLVGCLSGYSFDHPGWGEAAESLLAVFEQHVGEEETEFFALAQEAIGAERAEELDEQYEACKLRLEQSEQSERAV